MTTALVRNAASLISMASDGPLRGADLSTIDVASDGSVAFDEGLVSWCSAATPANAVDAANVAPADPVAPAAADPADPADPARAEWIFEAEGCTVVPGFVDPHTHLPFYGWRADEDGARLSGVRYETIHSEEGGIFRSARLLAGADDDDVVSFAVREAEAMLRHGTTTFEMKSGYGLSVEAELRQLRLARRAAESVQQRTVTTCLAAHAIPKGKSQGEWVGEVARDLLPVAAEEGLADACDIYVESIAFALEHAARLGETAASLGLAMRVHADQLADNQTASFATRWGFRSADHLNHTPPEGVGDLAESDTAAVLLPGATFTLRQTKKPPARDLVDAGALVALGSDFNPGTSPISSMPFVIALACRTYGLRPLEALAAATVNAAHVLGLGTEVGQLRPGYRGDAVILDAPSFDHLTYRPDADLVAAVICEGRPVYVAPRAERRITKR
jgi:imidazolonepropionase